jgi:hypothetical protein
MHYKTILTQNIYPARARFGAGALQPAHAIIETLVVDSPASRWPITLRQRQVDLHVQTVPLDRRGDDPAGQRLSAVRGDQYAVRTPQRGVTRRRRRARRRIGPARLTRQAFLTHALHQPLALTNLPPNAAQGPSAAPALPEYKLQLEHVAVVSLRAVALVASVL